MRKFCARFILMIVDASPLHLAILGLFVAAMEAGLLFAAATYEDTLFIPEGVGLLQNYGVFSSLFGDVLIVMLARLCFAQVVLQLNGRSSGFQVRRRRLREELRAHLTLQTRLRFVLYFACLVGFLFGLYNIGVHLLGDPKAVWAGDGFFDESANPLGFAANRLNGFISWAVVLPVAAFFCAVTFYMFYRIADQGPRGGAFYDETHPDDFGGFFPLVRAKVFYSIGLSVVFFQIAAHVVTFDASAHHYVVIGAASLMLLLEQIFSSGFTIDRINMMRDRRLQRLSRAVARGGLSETATLYFMRAYAEHGRRKRQVELYGQALRVGSIGGAFLLRIAT